MNIFFKKSTRDGNVVFCDILILKQTLSKILNRQTILLIVILSCLMTYSMSDPLEGVHAFEWGVSKLFYKVNGKKEIKITLPDWSTRSVEAKAVANNLLFKKHFDSISFNFILSFLTVTGGYAFLVFLMLVLFSKEGWIHAQKKHIGGGGMRGKEIKEKGVKILNDINKQTGGK